MPDGNMQEELYDLFGYMASAAKELPKDPPIYAPFRMVDAISRIIAIMANHGMEDEFMNHLRQFIEENKYSMMSNEEEFYSFLEQLVLKVAEKSAEA